MKNVIVAILQFVLFLLVFGIFSLFPPFHLQHVLGATASGTRIFVADGLVLAFVVYAVLLAVEALRRRFALAAPWTTIAFVLAVVVGLVMKFGFLTRSTF